jgi:purine-binding chemotaxis protein CheW
MPQKFQLVVFEEDTQRYALRLECVERVIRIVEITPLPQAPEIVLGIINLQGEIIPVLDIRQRFRLPERQLDLNDQMVIARTSHRKVALIVDSVSGVTEYESDKIIPVSKISPGIEQVVGVIKLEDGLIFIHDLDRFLALDEDQEIDRAMANMVKRKVHK